MKVVGGGSVQVWGPKDEGTHKPGPQELWQESVVLLWWDFEQGVGGYYRIGHETNLKDGPKIALWNNIITPDWVYKNTQYLPLRPQDRGETYYGSGDGELSYDFDGKNVVWTHSAPDIQGQLRVKDFHASIDCYPKKGQIAEFAPAHMEVAGTVSGELTVKGKSYKINGLAFRDHGWGERVWSTLLSHRWVAGVFGEDLSFVGLAWHAADDSMAQFGWVVRGDTVTYAKSLDIIALIEADALSCRGGTMKMTLTTDEVLDMRFEPLTPTIVSFHKGIACGDTLCRAYLGDRVGLADFEATNNIQSGSREPKNMLSGIAVNGWHPRKS